MAHDATTDDAEPNGANQTDATPETFEVRTEMYCRDCGKEIGEYVPVTRGDGSEKYVCVGCAEGV